METQLMPSRLELEVLDNVQFGDTAVKSTSFHALTLKMPENFSETAPEWANWKAGQFVMIRPVSWGNEILCARPFSIARLTERGLIIFFQTVGNGTEQLALLKSKDKVIVWGPLGTNFAVEESKPTLLVAGGIGVVPFIGYLDQHPVKSKVSMIFSHRAPSDCYPIDTISNLIELEEIQEKKPEDLQYFLNLIKEQMLEIGKKDGLVLSCGPMPLLEYIHKIAIENNIRVQLSLENKMACGVGACLGCVAKTSQKWHEPSKAGFPVQTCTSGPVFWAHDLEI